MGGGFCLCLLPPAFLLFPPSLPSFSPLSALTVRLSSPPSLHPQFGAFGLCDRRGGHGRLAGALLSCSAPSESPDLVVASMVVLLRCREWCGLPRRFPPLLRCENSFAPSVDGVSYPHPKTAGSSIEIPSCSIMAARIFQLCLFIFFFTLAFPLSSNAIPSKPNAEKPSSFDFIKHLEGCHKGETVEGLQQLKKYLEKFGYLNYNHSQNKSHANDDDFDDLLEAAIKTYQLNYHLKATGTLDAHTSQDFGSANLKIGFYHRDHGDGHPFDGPLGTLAQAWAPTDGRFHYDADETWSAGPTPGAFDLETVALHEIGHLLGLGHSSVPDAIMYASISQGVAKGLDGDDIQGIKALYNV
ncbi:hypothetical protein RHMOL_Rhmol08G0071600 [Rhododendron molle]|uniref:Uncharacterized protein n=1 Tax=Rhododendron molle TaxID=49168 RepID=A0ACC0ML05_RHOML|nr:hypothetical protein RHMOL_Rhmol08G0071600 [Rhododendron molle]